ncbi:hypothetical protein B0T16DRAFT_452166 [Cercophora newfieldiana]|uniref:Uncharacterized protein n=1 Tax=Cercophora newfieldiana TaxID=92897 RepID=A0AA40CYU0_9PEZI|nr:hypothetical protein B0T16DRAFT_452166 [Cercophora newfieldiana]
MHFTKVSAIVAQVSLTTASVLGGEDMGRRDWQAARDRALERAAAFEPRAPVVTSAPRAVAADWEADLEAGRAAAAAAVSSARDAAAAFRNRLGNGRTSNNKRDEYLYGPGAQWQDGSGAWQQGPPPANYNGPWMDGNGNQYNGQYQGQWQDAAGNWQQGPAPANYYNSAGAADNDWQSVASSWQAYGSSVAASASAQYAGESADWQTAASSAKSLASSYRSEYGVPEPTPMMPTPTPTMNKGSMGTTVRNGVGATPTSNRVQVNAAEGAGVGAAKVLGWEAKKAKQNNKV